MRSLASAGSLDPIPAPPADEYDEEGEVKDSPRPAVVAPARAKILDALDEDSVAGAKPEDADSELEPAN